MSQAGHKFALLFRAPPLTKSLSNLYANIPLNQKCPARHFPREFDEWQPLDNRADTLGAPLSLPDSLG